MRRTEALKTITRVLKQPVDDVPAADLIYGRALAHIEDPAPETPRPWVMQVDVLALKIAAALPLTDDTEAPAGPLAEHPGHPVVRRTDPRLQIMTETIERLIPGGVPANITVYVVEEEAGGSQNEWSGSPGGLADKLFTALYGRPRAGEQQSPLAQAEDAKRRRDLVGEVGALVSGHARLTSAPWYPARPGDFVHVHYERAGDSAEFGETYIVGDAGNGLMSLQLIAHNCPFVAAVDDEPESSVGCFAVDDDPEPLADLWMEAGPHRLTIIRDGRPVHIGGAR